MSALNIPEGLIWQYRQTLRAGRLNHTWMIKGEHGGIHVDAWVSSDSTGKYPPEWLGGIEKHKPCAEDVADHKQCWVIDGPCQHDGSSLQFREQIAPYLPYAEADVVGAMGDCHHANVLRTMLSRYRTWLKEPADEAQQEARLAAMGGKS